jgi:hypothetical protein
MRLTVDKGVDNDKVDVVRGCPRQATALRVYGEMVRDGVLGLRSGVRVRVGVRV